MLYPLSHARQKRNRETRISIHTLNMQGLKFFHINLHMIYHSKALDLDITDFEYHHDLTLSSKIIPSQTSGLLHVDINLFCVTESKKGEVRRAEQ